MLLATSAAGLQRLLDAAGRFLASMAMVISIPKTFVLVFNLTFLGPTSGPSMVQPYRLYLR